MWIQRSRNIRRPLTWKKKLANFIMNSKPESISLSLYGGRNTKANGKTRPLGIPSVRDRIIQESLRLILEPIFEPDFHPSSYGYRPGRSCQQAVAKADDMDLSKCFDRLDHELTLK